MVAAAISTAHSHPKTPLHHQNPPITARTPLLPSEFDNGVSAAAPLPPTRPNSRFVASRYMSSSSSSSSSSFSSAAARRFPSPLVSRTAAATPSQTALVPKRAHSVERRRQTTPLPDSRNGNAAAAAPESLAAAKALRTSCRSLSVSFQGESFSLPISKVKAAPASTPLPQPNSRKLTPERRRPAAAAPVRRDQVENSKPADQHRWPARNRRVDPLSRSLDFGNDKKVVVGGFGSAIRSTLQQSMIDDGRRASFDGRLRPDPDLCNADLDNGSHGTSDLTASDTDSVSSGSNSGMQEFIGIAQGRATPRGINASARFLQETTPRLRPSAEPSLPLSRAVSQPKPIPPKKLVMDSPIMPSRTTTLPLSSPLRASAIAPSPSKLRPSSPSMSVSSPARGMASPSRMRNSSVSSQLSSNTPSVLSFAVDARRWKIGESRIEDAHMLRLLYNRLLQWRFINARADAAIFIQRLTAEKGLYNAWEAMSELHDLVTSKRIQLQLLRQNSKLSAILKRQMSYLEEWAHLEKDHSNSLSGAIEALKASTLRLPVIGGAKADIQRIKDAICSAVDVMQALGSTMCPLLSKLERMNSLAAELSNVAAREQAVIAQCKCLLSSIAAMQVEECSLRTHLLQLSRQSNLTKL